MDGVGGTVDGRSDVYDSTINLIDSINNLGGIASDLVRPDRPNLGKVTTASSCLPMRAKCVPYWFHTSCSMSNVTLANSRVCS